MKVLTIDTGGTYTKFGIVEDGVLIKKDKRIDGWNNPKDIILKKRLLG